MTECKHMERLPEGAKVIHGTIDAVGKLGDGWVVVWRCHRCSMFVAIPKGK